MTDEKIVHTVDAKGLLCPLPIIRIAKAIKEIEPGQRLEIIADDLGILEDLPAWCDNTGHELISLEQVGVYYHGVVERI